MAQTIHEKNYMKCVSNQLNLPVFLVSRNRIKSNNITPLRGYIERKRLHYTKRCNEEIPSEKATLQKYQHIFGFAQNTPAPTCSTRPILKMSRDLGRKSPWLMAPNLYKIQKEPFSDLKGLGGALWKKLPTTESKKKKSSGREWKFYDADNEMETCNRYKGFFSSNARKHKDGARSMLSNLNCCYRNPNDPAPNAYYPQNYTLDNNVSPPIITKPPNPHIFLRRSCVPAKFTFIDQCSSKFDPCVGRYDIRYPNFCPCTWRLVVLPNLQLLIDRQKRLRFRRRPYKKIRARNYCAPDWRHVEGHGHQRLFKISRSKLKQYKIEKKNREARRSKDPNKIDTKEAMRPGLKLYADARYIGMINDPNRPKISFRKEPLKKPQPKIFFNCLKRYSRRGKISAVNKKIAFNSGEDRFKISQRPNILTVSKLKKLIESLPLERQFRDQPVMQKNPEEITPKLTFIPKRLQQEYELELRKRLFTFSPLPGTKMLVSENEVEIPNKIKYFDKILETSTFFKKDVRLSSTPQVIQEEVKAVG